MSETNNPQIDRLGEIKEAWDPPNYPTLQDLAWLIAEVERLRVDIKTQYDIACDYSVENIRLREELRWYATRPPDREHDFEGCNLDYCSDGGDRARKALEGK